MLEFSDKIEEISDTYRAAEMEFLNTPEVIDNTGR